MPAYLDADLSDSGVSSWDTGGAGVLFVAWRVTVIGLGPNVPDPANNPDRMLRLGWLSLGDVLTIGGVSGDNWREPIWLDFERGLWTPLPSNNTAESFQVIAHRLRWGFAPGTTVHVLVYGV